MRTQTLSILISDLQGYTERQARSSREAIARDLARHDELLRPVFAAFGGELVKSMGDAFLVCFESPTNAVLAAMQVQKQLGIHNRGLDDPGAALRVRIGIATGEVSRDASGDVFGDPVNLAARLQASAEPGAVWLAETTFLSMNKNEVQALEVGARVFKGVPGEVRVYRVLDDCIEHVRPLTRAELDRALEPIAEEVHATRRAVVLGIGAAVAAAAAGLVYLTRDRRPARERYASDPSDVASADAWLWEMVDELYDADERGAMQVVYREGVMAERLREMGPRLGDRPAYLALQAVYLMANEPLGPGVPELVAGAVERCAELRDDPRFRKLLQATCDYAAKNPEAQRKYLDTLQRL